MASSSDPLLLAGLDPAAIEASKEKTMPQKDAARLALEQQKEARLTAKEQRIGKGMGAAGKAPMGPPPLPPGPTVQELAAEKSTMLDKIAAYRDRFQYLKKRNTNLSAKSTFDEVADELHFIEMQLGNQTGGLNVPLMGLQMAMSTAETVARDYWNPLGLNLTGLGQVARENGAEFQPILDELMIKYSIGMYTSPETRLVLAVGAMIATVHSANNNPETARKMKEMHAQMADAAVPPGL